MKIFITGGAGYLGKAIMKFGHEYWPDAEYTVYSRDEAKHVHAKRLFPDTNFIIGDILDLTLLKESVKGHDIVIHAAAFKYVPQAEINPWVVSKINIDGSRNVITAACGAKVDKVIGISTDKACQPVNVYGMTKLVMERLFLQANEWGSPKTKRVAADGTKFNIVRYGNVVASSGSVIPIFRDQIRTNRELLITDPAMTRFWLSIRQAVRLIAEATGAGPAILGGVDYGVIVVPRCSATSLENVAKACVILEDNRTAANVMRQAFDMPPMDSVVFKTTGTRFGEKKHEELLTYLESFYAHNTDRGSWLLYPQTLKSAYTSQSNGVYTSQTPTHWITPDEMAEMIREAEEHESTT